MSKLIEALSDAVNDMGNALTRATWPEPTVEAFKTLVMASSDAETALSDLHDCVNELCYRCGQYKREHEGACNDCRWKKVKADV